MKWVWVVPTLILGYRFITYPSTLFQDHFAAAFHHYLAAGFLIPEFHTYGEMFGAWGPEYVRGLDQMRYTAPTYVGVAYSVAGWIAMRLKLNIANFRQWSHTTGSVQVDESHS